MRHILFDIDGTLIATGRAGSRGMLAALQEITGVESPNTTNFHGRTDSHLLPELLRVNDQEVTDELVEQVTRSYFTHLATALEECNGQVLPGILKLLPRLNSEPSVRVGLLTGNLPHSAQMKLEYYDIWNEFSFGFFGDISPDRNDLSRHAWKEISREYEHPKPADVIVIGDTPMDVECAKAIEARCLACCTGGCTHEELDQAGADWTVEDLSDTDAIFEWLCFA